MKSHALYLGERAGQKQKGWDGSVPARRALYGCNRKSAQGQKLARFSRTFGETYQPTLRRYAGRVDSQTCPWVDGWTQGDETLEALMSVAMTELDRERNQRRALAQGSPHHRLP